tara:strand:+ start:151 stop:504 length:354 start_codon:yes stop_codon:yes gene_type:complete
MNTEQKILDAINYCKALDVLKYFKSDKIDVYRDRMAIDGQCQVIVPITTDGKIAAELNEQWSLQDHIDKIGEICNVGSCMELGWICDNVRYYALNGEESYKLYPYHQFEKYVDNYPK